ncbi:MAG: D-alanyl-D-alanine dipeptidase [Bdellovibrio sp.]|nr:MAG: D-alanyl-D-alanine dipeptidase [Bdellovibrio sp.]
MGVVPGKDTALGNGAALGKGVALEKGVAQAEVEKPEFEKVELEKPELEKFEFEKFAIDQRPAGFVDLKEIDPSITQEMRYRQSHNFLGRRVRGYVAAKCILTRQAAKALRKVQAELLPQSLSLKVYDCYRPQPAVDDFVAWAKDLSNTKMRKEFYPRVEKANLFRDGYIAEKSGHSRGSTVDLTLVPLPAAAQPIYRDGDELVECFKAKDQRYNDNSVDMGTGFDCFDPLAHTENQEIGIEQRKNRHFLKRVMERHGFRNLPQEWWHFTLVDEPYPRTYFSFEVR